MQYPKVLGIDPYLLERAAEAGGITTESLIASLRSLSTSYEIRYVRTSGRTAGKAMDLSCYLSNLEQQQQN